MKPQTGMSCRFWHGLLLCSAVSLLNISYAAMSGVKFTEYDDVGNRFGYNIVTDDETGAKTIQISHVQYYTSVLWGNECVDFPSEIEGIKVTVIGRSCRPTHAMTVDIPEGVEEIEGGAFSGCEILEYVALPSTLKKIGMYAFNGCKKLTGLTSREYGDKQDRDAVTLPASVSVLGDYAFAGTAIERVDSMGSITTLSRGLFSGCTKLKRIVVPSAVSTMYCDCIGYDPERYGLELVYCKSPFSSCESLCEVYYLGDVPKIVEADPFSSVNPSEDALRQLSVYRDCPKTLVSYRKASFGAWPDRWNNRSTGVCVEINFDPSRGYYCRFPSRVYPAGSQFDTLPLMGGAYRGMLFLGWFTNPSNCGGVQVVEGTPMLSNDAYLYGHWDTIKYRVTLDSCGGTCDLQTVYYALGEFYGDLPTPVRKDYIFMGWYDASGNLIWPATQMFKEFDHALFAHWTGAACQVRFNGNGAACDVTSKTVTYGDDYGELPVPNSRAGYTFVGWRLSSASNGDRIIETTKVTTIGDHNLIAVWEPCAGAGNFWVPEDGKTYDNGTGYLSFTETEGGGSVGRKSITIYVPRSASIGKYLYEPVSEGRLFQGWYREIDWETGPTSERVTSTTAMPSVNGLSLHAAWSHAMIVFGYSTKVFRRPGQKYGEAPLPSRSGYAFNGWRSCGGGHYPYDKDMVAGYHDDWFYADWIANIYTVRYDPDGGDLGTESLMKKVQYDAEYGTLPEPIKEGYEFSCWKVGSAVVNSRSKVRVAGDHVLKACWTPKCYTLTFDFNGGYCAEDSRNREYGSICGELPIPTRTGYAFEGWFTAANGGSQVYSDTIVTESTTYYAHWRGNPCVVDFDGNGGTCAEDQKVVYLGDEYGTLPMPVRVGYDFVGWFTAATGGSRISESTVVSGTSNQTLYAQWTIATYTVIFDAMGGACSASFWRREHGAACGDLPIPTRTGYAFDGWFADPVGGSQIDASTPLESDITFYAHWVPNNYTVFFDANGGSCSLTSKNVTYGLAYGALPEPTLATMDFMGWYTALSGGSRVLASTLVGIVSDQTLYARWAITTYLIAFNAMGGGCLEDSRSCEHGSSYGSLPNPTRTGYSFVGWFTTASGGVQVSAATTATANATLYARWVENSYSVIYNANGGSGVMDSGTLQYDTDSELLSCAFVRKGYRFCGWATSSSGAATYTNGQCVKNLTTAKGGAVTLYAVWEPAGIKVNYFRQRYPWNGLVDLEIVVAGDAWASYPAVIQAVDGDGKALAVKTIGLTEPTANGNPVTLKTGSNHVIWDAMTDLGEGYKCDSASMRATLVTDLEQ